MKIQCSCGAKYEFDVTPEMAKTPVRFVCSACGIDASDFVNSLVRQELGLSAAAGGAAAPVPLHVAAPVQPAPQSRPVARMRIQTPDSSPTEAEAAASSEPQRCSKHPDQFVTEKCHVCSKPICPKCMALFGSVCSPLCKGRAETQGLAIPVYAGQKSVVEARAWRRTARVTAAICGLVAAVVGVWFWYAWFASVPKPVWSVHFPERSYSGQSAFCGKDQIVFLHGDLLARHDIKLKQETWSRHLVDKKQIEAAVAQEMKDMQVIIDKANSEHPDHVPKMPAPEKLRKSMQRAAEEALELVIRGQNIWVVSPGKLTRYDRDTGNPVKEIPVPAGFGGLIPRGDELLNVDLETGKPTVTHINLTTCESSTEVIASPTPPPARTGAHAAAAGKGGSGKAGLPVGMPGQDMGKVMDPKKVEEQAQHLSYPARIALPAILAHNMNQERPLAAMDDDPASQSPSDGSRIDPREEVSLIPTKDGFLQFSVKLIEARITTRTAMKAAPAKSALDGNLAVSQTTELANEMLNEAQRARGGEVVREDESRYQATIQRLDSPDTWSGEVIGPPALYPLTTVNVLTANKRVVVFDKANRKLWESALTYNVSGGLASLYSENSPYGQGPCVERKDALYVFDAGVLTAFDLAKGTVRWRLPSVGIEGLFFDDEGMIYVNTTTASPDTLKYSNQIDINRKDATVVMKIDPRTGQGLWSANLGGAVSYVSGKYIYTTHSYQAETDEESGPYTADSIAGRESFLSIKRINPKNGHVMWEHCQDRAPLQVQFDQNTIRLVFRKEVQVLRFLAL